MSPSSKRLANLPKAVELADVWLPCVGSLLLRLPPREKLGPDRVAQLSCVDGPTDLLAGVELSTHRMPRSQGATAARVQQLASQSAISLVHVAPRFTDPIIATRKYSFRLEICSTSESKPDFIFTIEKYQRRSQEN